MMVGESEPLILKYITAEKNSIWKTFACRLLLDSTLNIINKFVIMFSNTLVNTFFAIIVYSQRIIGSEKMNVVFNAVSIAIGIIGILLSAVSLFLFLKEKKKSVTIEWKEIPIAINSLSELMKKEFIPDIILVPSEKGGVIVSFLKKTLPTYTNCIFGIGTPIKRVNSNFAEFNSKDFYSLSTHKWNTYIPTFIVKYKSKKILIVDDIAMTGDFLYELKKLLIEQVGFDENNIKTMCLATTEIAIGNNKAPNYYWKKFDTSNVYLPWGKPE